jgi:hypothetical protein
VLFLTATPFQLGHGELLQLHDRFRAIDWRHGPSEMSAHEVGPVCDRDESNRYGPG